MALVIVHDIACSWCVYEQVGRNLLEPLPAGLLVHAAGPTDEGIRLLDIWDDERPGIALRADLLRAAIGADAAHAAVRDFEPVHFVIATTTTQFRIT